MNRIRIASVEASPTSLAVVADATAAYDPSLGLERFVRTFEASGHTLTIRDSVQMDAPHSLSLQYHFDGATAPEALSVVSVAPRGALVSTGPAFVTAAGPPGHVDRGPREERGSVLTVRTPAPVATEQFETTLTWK
jgi:hypothetical protein